MLIRDAEIEGRERVDLHIDNARITALAPAATLPAVPGEAVVEARGGALLPGLHDHHIHLAALAARAASVSCGPPDVSDAAELAAALARPGSGWLRGVGYHESVLGGLPDAAALDRLVADRPLRLQHRGGRMWLLNTMALEKLLARAAPPPGLESAGGRYTGRLFDEDDWLRTALGSTFPDLAAASASLTRLGVTGFTDMTARNDAAAAAQFAAQRAAGKIAQHVHLAGSLSLADAAPQGWVPGPAKLHLHESALPEFDDALAFVRSAHGQERGVAVHCVTEVELVFALALFEEAGTLRGDRIEHVSVAAPGLVARMAGLGLWACVQPHFVFERGDRYLVDVEPRHRPDLYRLRSLADAGLVMAGGSDAPYGAADPWAAMRAAVSRGTRAGATLGGDEALSPEAARDLFLADPNDLSRRRRVVEGAIADLVLLDRPWREARTRLDARDVRLVSISGQIVRGIEALNKVVDEPPRVRPRSAEAAPR